MSSLQFCPKEFIEHIWFPKLFSALLGQDYSRIPEKSVLIDKIAVMGKIQHIGQEHMSAAFQQDINRSPYKLKYLCFFIKNLINYDPQLIKPSKSDVPQITKYILNYKNGTYAIADYFIKQVVEPAPLELK